MTAPRPLSEEERAEVERIVRSLFDASGWFSQELAQDAVEALVRRCGDAERDRYRETANREAVQRALAEIVAERDAARRLLTVAEDACEAARRLAEWWRGRAAERGHVRDKRRDDDRP